MCNAILPDLDSVRTPWVLKELVGGMVTVDFVTDVICKTCRTRNMLCFFAIAQGFVL